MSLEFSFYVVIFITEIGVKMLLSLLAIYDYLLSIL